MIRPLAAGLLRRLAHPLRHWRFTLSLWLAVAAVAAGVTIWETVLKERFVPRRWGVVEPGMIYRSGMLSEHVVEETLTRHGIRVIVSLVNEEYGRADQNAERRVADKLGIERLVFPLDGDGTGEVDVYAQAVAAIDRARKAGRPVLVHCVAGTNRTGGVIAVYRLLVQGKRPAQAYAEMRHYRWDPRDNPDLLKFLNDHMGELARQLADMGVIGQVPDPLPQLGPK